MSRVERVGWVLFVLLYGGVLRAWMDGAFGKHDPAGSFLMGVITITGPAFLSTWLGKKMNPPAATSYDLLSPADRAVVDEALATGEPRGPLVLRATQRDIARQRLADNPSPRALGIGAAIAVALPLVAAAFAHERPLWLVAVTVLTLVAAGVLARRRWPQRTPPLDPDERARLKNLRRTAL